MIAPRVKYFILTRQEEESPEFNFIPGQFVTVHFDFQGKELKRSYSIANPPASPIRLEFAASYVENGPGTTYLFNLQPGDTVTLSGPYGRLILKEPVVQRYLFIGTGTGVTPYRAMRPQLEHLLIQHPHLEIVLMQGARTKEDLLFPAEFREWSKHSGRVKFLACLSQQGVGELAADERAGYIQQGLPELALHPKNDMVYLCGNPQMIDETFAYLQQQGFAVSQVVREKYFSR